MPTKEREKIFIRVAPELKAKWIGACKKLDQNVAGEMLIEWFTGQDDLLQAMILGNIPASPDLQSLLLKRLASKKPAPRPPSERVSR